MTCNIDASNIRKIQDKLQIPDIPRSKNICDYLMEFINSRGCLEGWKITKFLGIGTVGTVLGVCEPTARLNNNVDRCHAIKIQFVNSREERETIERESALQRLANSPRVSVAPHIIHECFFNIGDQECYSIIMEQLNSKSLDHWLTKRRTQEELNDLVKQLKVILESIKAVKLIHGDLVWFNLGYKETRDGIDVRLIDYDRAAVFEKDLKRNVKDAPQIDVLRLLMELVYPSQVQATINRFNKDVLFDELLKYAKQTYPKQMFDRRDFEIESENLWIDLYERYAASAKVKGLGSPVASPPPKSKGKRKRSSSNLPTTTTGVVKVLTTRSKKAYKFGSKKRSGFRSKRKRVSK